MTLNVIKKSGREENHGWEQISEGTAKINSGWAKRQNAINFLSE